MDDEKMVRFERAVDRLAQALPVNSGSQATITLNAGGIGVLISTACCAFMFGVIIIGSVVASVAYTELQRDFAEVREDQRATKAYLQGIWQQAPHLKPEQSEKKK